MVKLWTVFGTTLGFVGHVREYSDASAFALFRQYNVGHVVRHSVGVLSIAPAVIRAARGMTKKWPWSGYDQYLDVSVEAIRAEFAIVALS